jgi:hypothetical protein
LPWPAVVGETIHESFPFMLLGLLTEAARFHA